MKTKKEIQAEIDALTNYRKASMLATQGMQGFRAANAVEALKWVIDEGPMFNPDVKDEKQHA